MNTTLMVITGYPLVISNEKDEQGRKYLKNTIEYGEIEIVAIPHTIQNHIDFNKRLERVLNLENTEEKQLLLTQLVLTNFMIIRNYLWLLEFVPEGVKNFCEEGLGIKRCSKQKK